LLRLAAGFLIAAAAARADMPTYARAALNHFNPEVPPGWAYTLGTVRNNRDRTLARYDPARAAAERWTLLELNGRPPSDKERTQFRQAATAGGSAAPQANFTRADIDPASLQLVREDAERGEFVAAFREQSAGADKMLGHLRLRLSINRLQPHVEQYTLELKEPYSPVLGVKMRLLLVTMRFSPPAADRPSLPVSHTSRFLGRIFFIGMEENIEITFTDYARRP
jgi:hypothetical protein